MNIFFSKPNKLIATLNSEDCEMLLGQNKILKILYNNINYIYLSIIKTEDKKTPEKKEYLKNGDFILMIFENKLPVHNLYPREIVMPKNTKKIEFFVMRCLGREISKIEINKRKNKTEVPESKPTSPNYKNIKKFLKKRALI